MTLTRLAVFKPVMALTVTLSLIVFGLLSYASLGLEQNPELNLPIVTVQITYPGASARSVEEQVTRRVDDAVAGLGNIELISSTSRNSMSAPNPNVDSLMPPRTWNQLPNVLPNCSV